MIVVVEVAINGRRIEIQLDGKPVALLTPTSAGILAANLLHAAQIIETGAQPEPSLVPARS